MDCSHLDQEEKRCPETSSESSQSSDSPDSNDIFGDPFVHPRVGDEYQVEIPPLLTVSKGIVDRSYSFLTGLPIPIMWVCNQTNPINSERLEDHDGTRAVYSGGLVAPTKGNGSCLVPGLPTEFWSEFEADCFILGLYLLGKNFVQVKRFVESKGMGQILAYYYGQFCTSAGYIRWSECRKMRGKKCVIGHKFFTVYREQELFSRLSPHVCHHDVNLDETSHIADHKEFADRIRTYEVEGVNRYSAICYFVLLGSYLTSPGISGRVAEQGHSEMQGDRLGSQQIVNEQSL